MGTWTLEQAYYIGELIATFAVIISLIYVAAQIRQNTYTIKLSSAQNLSHELREALALLVSDVELTDIHFRAMNDINSLAPRDKFRFYMFLNNVFRVYENAHYQNTQGAVDQPIWNGMLRNMNATKKTSGYQAFWQDRKYIFSKEFQDFYENELSGDANILDIYQGK